MMPQRENRRRGAPAKREGIVMLIVMLMLMMATGTAMFTMQATQYEQRASSSIGEANWARGLAECSTMAGVTYAGTPTFPANPTPADLGTFWIDSGGTLSAGARKFAIPTPSFGNPTPGPNAATNPTISISLNVPPPVPAANVPGGLGTFLPGARGSDARWPLRQQYDNFSAAFAPDIRGTRYVETNVLIENYTVGTIQTSPGITQTRSHRVITGIAEVHVWGDSLDSSGVREIHELDAISRGYVDIVQ